MYAFVARIALRGRTRPSPALDDDAVRRNAKVDASALVDRARPACTASARRPSASAHGIDERVARRQQRSPIERARELGARLRRARRSSPAAPTRSAAVARGVERRDVRRRQRHEELARALEVARRSLAREEASPSRRGSPGRAGRARRASSSPKCAIASSCEWSKVSPTMPALRPGAP